MPDNVETRANRGLFYICWKADTRPLRQTIDAILAQGAGAIASAADIWFFCALAERDPAAAERALVALGDNPCWGESAINLSRSFGEGLLARMTKDEARARTAFEAARAQQEKIVQAQPDYGPALCVLGLIDAALGRKDLALDEGRRAIALTPVEKDVNNGSRVLQYFAITAAWAGDKELALQQLEAGLRAPNASLMLSYGALKLFPVWGPAPRRSALRANRRLARAKRTPCRRRQMNRGKLFSELKRRNVIRRAVIFTSAASGRSRRASRNWASLGAPEWVPRWFLVAAGIGFPIWVALRGSTNSRPRA